MIKNQNNFKSESLNKNKNIINFIENLSIFDCGKYKHLIKYFKEYVNKKNKNYILKNNFKHDSIFYDYIDSKIKCLKKVIKL